MISKKDLCLRQAQNLSIPLSSLRGVGPKRAALLARKGLQTVLDLFYFIPIRYEDRTRISPVKSVEDERPVLVKGKVIMGQEQIFYPGRKRLFKILIRDGECNLELLWFRYRKQHMEGLARPGSELSAYGSIKRNRGKRQMFHPDIALLEYDRYEDMLGFFPVYSSIEGISNNILRSLVKASLDTHMEDIVDPVPEEIIDRLNLPGLARAIEDVHFPPEKSSMELLERLSTPAHRRLIFDRFFHVMLFMAYRNMLRKSVSAPISLIPTDLINNINNFFHFNLTSDQLKTVKEITKDLASGRPMNRLIIGDVCTGKTVIAAVAAYIIIQNNRQVALMIPTQLLADQHMNYFSGLSEEFDFRPVVLTGDLKKRERDRIYEGINTGKYNFIIGTHSLIQDNLAFSDLGLVIIDEQHRFGVRHRALMDKKGHNPHMLAMTATPIPRSMAITLYGDMDISMIREYPEGHTPVATYLVNEAKKRWLFDTIKERMSSGQQVFVICPVIEGSEDMDIKSAQDMGKRLKKILSPPFRIEIIHGRLSPDKKDQIMRDFHKGLIDLLVGTTIIEVGIHAPNATVMIIEHPERFGLAQIHQLRGRVGRGTEGGICAMMLKRDLNERALARLEALAESQDGFEIARKDFELRGHGELTGVKQAGAGELDLSEIIEHQKLFFSAKREAWNLIKSDPGLLHPDNRHLRILMEKISEIPVDI